MFNTAIREWLRQTLGDEIAKSGIGAEICRFLAAFYTYDGLIQSRDLALLQSSFDILDELFKRVCIHTNTKKTVTMVCVPGKIRTPHLKKVYDNGRQGIITLGEWQC